MQRCVLAMILAALIPAAGGATPACAPRVEAFALALPGASSRAEILRPPAGKPLAVIVLIHGSDVADLDSSIVAKGGRSRRRVPELGARSCKRR